MTLDECVYALADLLDEMMDSVKALDALKGVLSIEDFSVDEVVEQFTKDYVCDPEVYVKNLQDDEGFDSL